MRSSWRDLRHALRLGVRQPGLTVSTVLVLGVALGAAAVVFGMIDAVLLRPLPYREPERLVSIWNQPDAPGVPLTEISFNEAAAWRTRSRSLAGLALTTQPADTPLTAPGEPEQVRYRFVSTDFFSLLGVGALRGRTFEPGRDDRPETRIVMVSEAFWRRRFQSDPGLLGRPLSIGSDAFAVVGVVRGDLPFPRGTDLWFPLSVYENDPDPEKHNLRIFQGVGRLLPGITAEQAAAELSRIARQRLPPGSHVPAARVVPLDGEILGDSRPALHLMAWAVALLLLIACANVAGLLLTRAVARRREMALRAALGAGQGRLIGQIVTESLLLAALAAGLGLAIAGLDLRLVARLGTADIPRLDLAALDSRTIAFTLTAALLGVALFGFLPAFEAVSADLGSALREGERATDGARVRRLRDLLVAGETALAVVVLILAGLTGRSFLALWQANLGFAPQGRLAFHVVPSRTLAEAEQAPLFRELLRRVQQLPGVDGAGLILMRPLAAPIGWDYRLSLPGQTPEQLAANPIVNYERVSPGLLHTLGIPLLAGRDFAWTDTAEAPPVAIVSRAAAERLWPGRPALGRRLRWRIPGSPWMTVIGVAGNVRYRELEGVRPDVYVPFLQQPGTEMDAVLHSGVPAREMESRVRAAVRAFDPSLVVGNFVPLESAAAAARARPRLRALVLGTFASFSLVLAAVGIYGSVAYAVAQRRRELAIRYALGATRKNLLRLTLGRALAASTAGIAAGLLAYGSLLLQPRFAAWLAGLLYETGPGDPEILLGAPLFLLAVALLAGLLSVRGALRPDAASALRTE